MQLPTTRPVFDANASGGRDLGDLPALAVDLADTMARVSGAKTGDHRRSADTPLPYMKLLP